MANCYLCESVLPPPSKPDTVFLGDYLLCLTCRNLMCRRLNDQELSKSYAETVLRFYGACDISFGSQVDVALGKYLIEIGLERCPQCQRIHR